MSAREWKPGDVAMVTDRDGERSVAVCHLGGGGGEANYAQRARWLTSDGDEVWSSLTQIRPLVVIDPEDAERVRAFADTYARNQGLPEAGSNITQHIAAALREFANPTPPKPEEPTGLGAVVEAIYDNHFVHVGNGMWQRIGVDEIHPPCPYDAVAAIRILSPGVEP